jgi:hypothetical protein
MIMKDARLSHPIDNASALAASESSRIPGGLAHQLEDQRIEIERISATQCWQR